ncbi:MAG TPA: NAD(P)H-dependent oxidoreductase [Chitinophagales bacterium]|nr:NAD(P)H-dependent oxidoreductase [Chitinophagales bacterium]
MNITIISGSPRKHSLTARAAKFLQHYMQEKYPMHNYETVYISEHPLPFVEKVWSSINEVPEEHKALAEKIFATDAFILVSPEYNGSYSPAMKNLLDHFPKQGHKAFGIVTASPGAMGGIRAAQQMQNLVAALFGVASPYMLIVPAVDKKFDAEGNLTEPAFINSIHTFTAELMWIAGRIAPVAIPV